MRVLFKLFTVAFLAGGLAACQTTAPKAPGASGFTAAPAPMSVAAVTPLSTGKGEPIPTPVVALPTAKGAKITCGEKSLQVIFEPCPPGTGRLSFFVPGLSRYEAGRVYTLPFPERSPGCFWAKVAHFNGQILTIEARLAASAGPGKAQFFELAPGDCRDPRTGFPYPGAERPLPLPATATVI